MPRRLSTLDVVAALYEEEGLYEVGRSEEALLGASARLLLSDGKIEIAVNILEEDVFTSRGALHDALLEAEKLLERYEGVVIAIPRRYHRAIDESVLMKHGIGLVIYDSMGAEEIVPPRIRERKRFHTEASGLEKTPQHRSEEIVELKKELSRVLKILEEFEARLDRLEKEQRRLSLKIGRLESPKPVERVEPQRVRVDYPEQGGNLPSFLQDNPWVKILSRRE